MVIIVIIEGGKFKDIYEYYTSDLRNLFDTISCVYVSCALCTTINVFFLSFN